MLWRPHEEKLVLISILQALLHERQQMDPWYLVLCSSNAFLSYTATMLNIVTIHAIRKTPSLSKNLKTLLLSQAISVLGVGLLVQPIFVAQLNLLWNRRKTMRAVSLITSSISRGLSQRVYFISLRCFSS